VKIYFAYGFSVNNNKSEIEPMNQRKNQNIKAYQSIGIEIKRKFSQVYVGVCDSNAMSIWHRI